MSADARRMEQTSLCGANVNGMNGRGSRAVPDDSFIKLPRAFQCEACLATHWPGNWPPRIQRSGVRTHRMALEMLFAMLQRMWQARLEVGHRCYHPWDDMLGATKPSCTTCDRLTTCHVGHVNRWLQARGDLYMVDVLGADIKRAPNIRWYPQFGDPPTWSTP